MEDAVHGLVEPLRRVRRYLELSPAARAERRRDARGVPIGDPGLDRVIQAGLAWLATAQDRSASQDGGVARHYSLLSGWSTSYPETTGYIIPTLLAYGREQGDRPVLERAKRMVDWLVSIQLPEGGFQGGMIHERPVVPVTFNTGQILLGLAAAAEQFGEPYRRAMIRAADWLVATQDEDGCWRRHPSPFAGAGEKAYDTHVAWGLFEAARVEPARGYAEAALANVRWACSHQRANGWFDRCCLTDPSHALTHTIGYVLRGVLEAYRFTGDRQWLDAGRRTAEAVLGVLDAEGGLPGRLKVDWTPAVSWSCLTGTSQLAICWLLLFEATGDTRYREAAFRANRYVRRTVVVDGPPEIRGAVKGSFPVDGSYNPYAYLNWACKFTVDANVLERRYHER